MIKGSLFLLSILVWSNVEGQTIKTNVLAPLSFYSEFKTKPKETIQLGVSYVPYYFNINKVNDASIILEYRRYKPKIGSGMDKLWAKSFPRGPYIAPYVKMSRISRLDKKISAFYFGLSAGHKQMRLLGQPKKSIEFFAGIGLGSPILVATPKELKGTKIDVRLGLALGIHYAKKEEKSILKLRK